MIIPFQDHIYDSVYTFPVGGNKFFYKNGISFIVDLILGIRVEDFEGTVWGYKGISYYKADNLFRVKGWQKC